MSCGSCASGACGTGSKPAGCNSNGGCQTGSCAKLDVFDWLAGMELQSEGSERIAEVRFKNTRKEFYEYKADIEPIIGDCVVVETANGYDIGSVSLTGELVPVQMKKKNVSNSSLSKIKRLANQEELDKWKDFQGKEKESMIKARKISKELQLDMKISDVEYQADGTKATFYYTSEGRVDFRELIKKFASTFKIRVEMKQIGTRQEAGRLGGIGSCGRELCCSSWLSDFRTVSTSAARYQQLAINPIKLAGQCGKLKCCLNYELDTYMDALQDFPKGDIKLFTRKGLAFLQKTDIFKRVLWFSYADEPAVFHPVTLERVKEIMEMNQFKQKPEDLKDFAMEPVTVEKEPDYENVVGQDDLKRFDSADNKNRRKRSRNRKPSGKRQGNNNEKKAGGSQKPQAKNNGNKGNNSKRNNNNAGKGKKQGEQKQANANQQGNKPKAQNKEGGNSKNRRNRKPKPNSNNNKES